MFNIKEKLFNSRYLKSLFQLSLGSFIAQLITIIVSPISTRIYSPEEIGMYTLLLTVTSIFGPVINGKYDLSIVSAEDDDEVYNLVAASGGFMVVFLIFISIGYSIYLYFNPEIIEVVGWFAFLVLPLLLAIGLINILTSYNNRYLEYKLISSVYVVRTLTQNVFLIIFGLFGFGAVGLISSQLLGSLFGVKKQSNRLMKKKNGFKKVTKDSVKKVLKKYKKQPLYSLPANFISSSSYSILNFFITALFGLSSFGYYSMTYRVLGMPISLVSSNMSKIFFQRASEEKRRVGNYNRTLKQITFFLIAIAIPMVLVLLLFAPKLFEVFLGDAWGTSGIYARIMAPMFGIRFVVGGLTPAFIISNKQKYELVFQSLFLVSSILSYVICKILMLDILYFLTFVSIVHTFIYCAFYCAIYKISK